MARLRSAPSTQANAPAKPSTRQALKEKTNTTHADPTLAGEFKDFVKDARSTRGRGKKAAQTADEYVMAGGLGQRSDALPSEPPMTRDDLVERDGHPPSTAKANRRAPRQARRPAQNEAQSRVFEDMKKRMRATAQKEALSDKIEDAPQRSDNTGFSSDALPSRPPVTRQRNEAVNERSEFSISPSPPPPGKLSEVKNKQSSAARPESVLKSQSTPAAETSVLALKNFKRRPRQPSMLAMVQQRTASARPSAVHVQAADEAEDPSIFDVAGSDEDEEEFAPDAEGTPLHLKKARRTSDSGEKRVQVSSKKAESRAGITSRKRTSDEVENVSSSLGAVRVKRQRQSASAREETTTPAPTRSRERRESLGQRGPPQSAVLPEVQVINSSPSSASQAEQSSPDRRERSVSAEVVIPSTEEQSHQKAEQRGAANDSDDMEQPVAPSETMADPASSSPVLGGPVATQETDILADPPTQVTPLRPRRVKDKKERKAKPMMTSTLQGLLPKRRQPLKPRHRKSEYDIDSASDEDAQREGDDSDGDLASRRRRQQTKASATSNRKSTTQARPPAAARKSTAPTRNARKSAAPPSRRKTTNAASKKAAAKNGKTYGRNAASDKENDNANSDFEQLSDNDDSALPDTSLTMHEAALSGELAAAKAKFAEVDDWDMEFESVSFEEGRSSSQTWR